MALKKLNESGFSHLIIGAIVVIAAIAAFGTYQIIKSSAMRPAGGSGNGGASTCTKAKQQKGECPTPPKGPQ